MLRRKRYLLPEIEATSIPKSTKHYRKTMSGQTEIDSSLSLGWSKSENVPNNNDEPPLNNLRSNHSNEDHAIFSENNVTQPMCTSNLNLLQNCAGPSVIDNMSHLEAVLLYSMLRNGWSRQSVTDIFMILQSLPLQCGFKIPSVSKFLKKYCDKSSSSTKYTCPKCSLLLSDKNSSEIFLHDSESIEPKKYCRDCKEYYTVNHLSRNQHYFLTFDLSVHLREFLERSQFERIVGSSDNKIRSIVDGKLYQEIKESIKFGDNDYTLTVHYDGIPIFGSSKKSLWPVLVSINELPECVRKTSTFISALWLSEKKPDTNVYLLEAVKELKKLEKGISYIDSKTEEINSSKFFTIICTADSVARCMAQNMSQFNGEFGCGHCFHPGIVVTKGKGHCRAYPYDRNITERTDHEVRRLGRKAYGQQKTVFGVKDNNPFMLFAGFDVVRSFVIDSMHCLMLGITRMLISTWFDKKYRSSAWHIGSSVHRINKRMLSMLPTSEVQRYPRSFNEMKYFKASEWSNIVLYYGYSVFEGILAPSYYEHFTLFVTICHNCLQKEIHEGLITEVEALCESFICGMESLYGVEFCSFNIHQLRHIAKCLRDWGPLHNYSCFSYETHLGILKKAVHCGRLPIEQISNFVSRLACSNLIMNDLLKHNPVFYQKFVHSDSIEAARIVQPKKMVYRRDFLKYHLEVPEGIDSVYLKVGVRNVLFTSGMLQTNKSCDSFILLKDTHACQVLFAYFDRNSIFKLSVRLINSTVTDIPYLMNCTFANDIKEIDVADIDQKLVYVRKRMLLRSFYLFRAPH